MTTDNTSAHLDGVCDKCFGWVGEPDPESGEMGPCTACFGMARRAQPSELADEVRRLRGLLAAAQAFDDLVAQVWTAATGSTHEGPASVDALLNTVLDMRNSRDALRYEVSAALHLPPTIGPASGELARVMRATEEARDTALAGLCPQGFVVIPLALHDAACRLASDVPRLQREVTAARREGAEAMREACIRALVREGNDADDFRALPLPGGAS